MPLLENGQLVEDKWTQVADDAALPANTPAIVSLARWQNERDALAARTAPLGIRLESDERANAIAGDLAHFDVVALNFPAFTDGRPYTTARLLRERYGFRGELRATGEVLRDQFQFLLRCGFDALEVRDAAAAAAWRDAVEEIGVFYQPAADDHAPAYNLRHRRVAAE